jgi:hypothetical protein
MIGVAIALIVVGVLCLFIVPWVGIVTGFVGLVVALALFVNFARGGGRGRREAPHL